MRRTLGALVLAALLCAGCTGTRPTNLGVTDGRLAPVPETPNCVSSQTDSEEHFMEPWPLEVSADSAILMLEAAIVAHPRSKLVVRTRRYLHAEFVSDFWRFVDDTEFYVDERAGLIHFRSASRVGRSDWGVNRERMERLRELYDGADP